MSAGFAVTFALAQAAARHGDDVAVTWVARCFAVIAVTPLLLYVDTRPRQVFRQWPILAVMATLDAFALMAIVHSGRLDHPEFAAVTSSSFGAVTVFLAWLVRGERISPRQWLGMGLIFSGVAVLSAS